MKAQFGTQMTISTFAQDVQDLGVDRACKLAEIAGVSQGLMLSWLDTLVTQPAKARLERINDLESRRDARFRLQMKA